MRAGGRVTIDDVVVGSNAQVATTGSITGVRADGSADIRHAVINLVSNTATSITGVETVSAATSTFQDLRIRIESGSPTSLTGIHVGSNGRFVDVTNSTIEIEPSNAPGASITGVIVSGGTHLQLTRSRIGLRHFGTPSTASSARGVAFTFGSGELREVSVSYVGEQMGSRDGVVVSSVTAVGISHSDIAGWANAVLLSPPINSAVVTVTHSMLGGALTRVAGTFRCGHNVNPNGVDVVCP